MIVTQLVNGVHVVIKHRPHLPLVSIAIATRAGAVLETRQLAGVTSLMARTSIKGTPRRTAAQIAEEAEGMGGSVSPSGGGDLIDWEITVPSRHFSSAFDLLSDVAFNAHFPDNAVEIERKLTLSDLQQTRDDMHRYPLRLCMQTAFAGHPYGYSLDDLETGVGSLTADDLRTWRNERLHADTWVFVVGDIDSDDVLHEVQRRLPTLATDAKQAVTPAKWQGSGQRVIESREKAQSALAIAFPGPARGHEDVYTLQVLANAVGGLGGRFFEELRSKRSLAYTVALSPMSRMAGGAFIGYIATSPEREDEARAGLLEQFALLAEDPLPDHEVSRSKRYTIGTWHIRNQTNAAQLNELLQAYLLGGGHEEIRQYEPRIMAVTPERIREVAKRYFRPELAVEGVVRGTGKSR